MVAADPEQRRQLRVRRRLVAQQLPHDRDDGPVGDPLAVGEAAPRDDRRVDPGQELRGQPGLPDSGRATNDKYIHGARDVPADFPIRFGPHNSSVWSLGGPYRHT